jgi:V/A-type H+/Na+-transporting ATPase subunit I
MISPMSSIEVVGPLRLFDKTLEVIQSAGVLQIEEVPLSDEKVPAGLHRIHYSPEKEKDGTLVEGLVRLLAEAVAHMPAEIMHRTEGSPAMIEAYRRWEKAPLSELAATTRILHSKARSLVRRARNLDDDLRLLAEYEEVVGAFVPLVEGGELPRDLEFVGVILEKHNKIAHDLLKQEVEKITGGDLRFVETALGSGRTAVLLGFLPRHSRAVRYFVSKAGISEMRFPRYLRDKAFEEALAALEGDLSDLRKRRTALTEQTGRFFAENGAEILGIRGLCADMLARHQAVGKAARTHYAFVLRGWIVRKRRAGLAARLAAEAGDTVVLKPVKASNMGKPPVLLANPRPVRHFEPLLGLLSLPAYGTIDPTSFVATFFPPMFGLMLGDIGYGALVGVLAAVLFRLGARKPLLRNLGIVFGFCAFFAIAFGFVFGELFGDAGHALGLRPLWRERLTLHGEGTTEAVLGYLMIAVGVGSVHVLLGLVMGIFAAHKSGDHGQVLGHAARITGIAILFIFVGRLVDLLPPVFTSFGIVGAILFLVIMVALTVHNPQHGLLLPLEVLGTIGNILSYARLMAIGMASVVLALLANMLAGMVGNVVLAALIVVLVHALNLTLGILDPTIQGLRLHYVEFFSKFYISGGRKFAPLSKLGGVEA